MKLSIIGSNVSYYYLQISLTYVADVVQIIGILDSGHYMFEEKPDRVLEVVYDFLRQIN